MWDNCSTVCWCSWYLINLEIMSFYSRYSVAASKVIELFYISQWLQFLHTGLITPALESPFRRLNAIVMPWAHRLTVVTSVGRDSRRSREVATEAEFEICVWAVCGKGVTVACYASARRPLNVRNKKSWSWPNSLSISGSFRKRNIYT